MNNSRPRTPSIRSRLLYLVVACLAPAALMAALLIAYDYIQARNAFITGAMSIARANAIEVDKEFALLESTLTALATSPSLERRDLQAFHLQAGRVAQAQNIFNIVLEDGFGQQLVNTYRPYGAVLPEPAMGPALRFIHTRDATAISNLFVGKLSKRHIASVGIPVDLAGGRFGALSATVTVERFNALLRQQNYPEHWITSVLDREGSVVARSAEPERFVGHKALPKVMAHLRDAPEQAFETHTLDGTPLLAVTARAAASQWTVAIGIPLAALNAELNRKLWLLVLSTVVLLGASLLGAWRIGTRIRRSIRSLVAPAMALGSGECVAAAAYGLREADEVGEALVKASSMHAKARHDATHDPLTGLANRAMFSEFLVRQVELCARSGAPLSLLYLDLDRFKFINDTYGHNAGDLLLKGAATRLQSLLRKSDLAARLGGDEFAVVLVGSSAADTATVVQKLEHSLGLPYQIEGHALVAGASIGAATYPECGERVPDLVASADHAMYRRKTERRQAPA
ncbi:MAG: diguanylate cyclase [Duganella sp.]